MVVDNHSTDGTREYLIEWEKGKSDIERKVIGLEQNLGGSGGFYKGLQMALKKNVPWIWVSDDDAYLETDCLKKLVTYIQNHDSGKIAALCGRVETSGKIDTWHRRRLEKKGGILLEKQVEEKEYEREYFALDLFSYVGCMIKKEVIQKAGLDRKSVV